MKQSKHATRKLVILSLALVLLLTQAASVAAAPAPQGEPVEIKNWYMHNWSLILSLYSCRGEEDGCWANPNYHESSWLLSASSVYIDPSWKAPALVYWSKHYSRRAINFCYIEVQSPGDTRWDRIKTIGGTKDYWHQVSVDLKAYSGEKLLVKFYCEPHLGIGTGERGTAIYNKQILYVDDVTIVPEATQ